jgi:hypothetical protein
MPSLRSLITPSVLGLSLCLANAGCGSSAPPPVDATPAIASVDQLRDRLTYIAESGQTGSGLAGLEEVINTVPDEAKKKALLADYTKLSQATSAQAAKTLAKAMLGKL